MNAVVGVDSAGLSAKPRHVPEVAAWLKLPRLDDLHATILRLMGLDHEKLTYFHQGRHEPLTDVYGNVVKAVLA